MTETDHHFRVVMRGYDSAEVDRAITELQSRLTAAEQAATDLSARLQQSETSAAQASAPPPATFDHLGERVGQILGLADQEAAEMREQATAQVETMHKDAEQASLAVREAADEYAEQRRREADAEGTQLLTDARRAADEERDAAERDASALRQEAEAVYEKQRANAAEAAAKFETTLAERRDRTTAEFQEKQAATQAELDAMSARIEDMRTAGQREQAEAEAEARRIVSDAEERASVLTRDARAAADRVRAESDRELAAAVQRRDSINAQLANVRQMLATLTGSVPGVIAVDADDADSVEADAEISESSDHGDVVEGDADVVSQEEDDGEPEHAEQR